MNTVLIGWQITASPNRMPAAPRWLGGPLRGKSRRSVIVIGMAAARPKAANG
jgi:hypothetical protein